MIEDNEKRIIHGAVREEGAATGKYRRPHVALPYRVIAAHRLC
jgi:hypothetical protein